MLAPEAQYTISGQKKARKKHAVLCRTARFLFKKITRYHWSRVSELAIISYLKITNGRLGEKTEMFPSKMVDFIFTNCINNTGFQIYCCFDLEFIFLFGFQICGHFGLALNFLFVFQVCCRFGLALSFLFGV